MFWMLLPPGANAGRHIEPHSRPLSGSWVDLLRTMRGGILHVLSPGRRRKPS
jgi:hypothetical protein